MKRLNAAAEGVPDAGAACRQVPVRNAARALFTEFT